MFYSFLSEIYHSGKSCEIKNFKGLELWHCPCGSIADFNDIGITLGGWEIYLKTENFIKIAGNNECAIEIQEGDFEGNNEIIIFGSNFLFNYYVINDIGNMKIGLYGDKKKVDDEGIHLTISSTIVLTLISYLILDL